MNATTTSPRATDASTRAAAVAAAAAADANAAASAAHDNQSDDDAWSADDSVQADHGGSSRKRKADEFGQRPMSVSCELCKQRKVKCDRGQPACGWCVKNNQLCEYKERKKPGLRAGYGRELEARLDRLEGILQQQQATISQLLGQGQPVTPSSTSEAQMDGPVFRNSVGGANQHPPHTQRAEAALFLQKPVTAFPHPQFSTSAPIVPEYGTPINGGQASGYPSVASTGHALHSASLSSGSRDLYQQPNPALPSASLNIEPKQLSANTASDQDLPPYDLLYALADLFFKHVNTWCPILHRRSTLDSLFGPTQLDEDDKILLHAMVATTMRFSTDARLTDEARERYHAESKKKVLLYGLENSSVKSLQALVILALDLVGASNGPPGWNLLALITRSVVQLGLAVEQTSFSVSPNFASIYTLRAMVLPEARDWIEEESRRRMFWMVYLLDRYATIATAFEFALDEREIDRRLPCRDDLFSRNNAVETRWFKTSERHDYTTNHPENLGSFSYYIEIIGILSRIHQFLKKPVDISRLEDVERWQMTFRELDSALTDWKFGLPSEYGNINRVFGGGPGSGGNKIVNCGWIMLHAAYHMSVIRLHSSAAYPTTRSPIFTPSYTASQRCLNAVENITALCTYVLNDNMLPKLGPPFAFTVWVAARLLLVHGSTIDHALHPSLEVLVTVLREMGRYWRVADRYRTLLERVLHEYRDSEREGADVPGTVKILADMRRTAFDLDFLISRQPLRQSLFPKLEHHPASGSTSNHHGADGNGSNSNHPPSIRATPAPNELEYLDVFDFFNMPRLPVSFDNNGLGVGHVGQDGSGNNSNNNNGGGGGGGGTTPAPGQHTNLDAMALGFGGGEFNITNYTVNQDQDWFMKGPG